MEQSGLNVMELTIPFAFGSQDVTVYGLVALKLNTLFRVYVVPFHVIVLNVPTAYMVLPHCTSCRTCWNVPVFVASPAGACPRPV